MQIKHQVLTLQLALKAVPVSGCYFRSPSIYYILQVYLFDKMKNKHNVFL